MPHTENNETDDCLQLSITVDKSIKIKKKKDVIAGLRNCRDIKGGGKTFKSVDNFLPEVSVCWDKDHFGKVTRKLQLVQMV